MAMPIFDRDLKIHFGARQILFLLVFKDRFFRFLQEMRQGQVLDKSQIDLRLGELFCKF